MPERMELGPAEDMPAPSAELVLFRVHVEALVSVLGRKKAERYLTTMAEQLAWEENLSALFQLRPLTQQKEVALARKQAAVMFQRLLPIFLASLPKS